MKRTTFLLSCLFLLLAAPSAGAALADKLVPAACGVRHTLWFEHYAAQLYVAPGDPAAVLADPARPKMVRMRILNAFFMPPDIPKKWRGALQGAVDAGTMARLAQSYDALQRGDTVVVSYVPREGLSVRINDHLVAKEPGHAAIDALLQAWADDAPLAKKVAGTLRRHRCA